MDRGLRDAVEQFTQALGATLREAAGATSFDAAELDENATIEAFNLCCATIDSDKRQTDDELWALISTFSGVGLLPGATTPSDLRKSNLILGKSEWLQQPSDLFELLLQIDQRDGGGLTWTYVDQAMLVIHMVASIDKYPSQDELQAGLHFQSMLLQKMGARPNPNSKKHVQGHISEAATNKTESDGPATSSDDQKDDDSPVPEPEPEPLESVLAELDQLIGLAAVKEEVRLLSSLLRVQKLRAERGLPVVDNTKHLVFSGNPGTGKTTVARLLARVYHSLGVVERGQLTEVDRGGLVAGFVGQTAGKVADVFEGADGGVLLIDEAYSLIRGGEKDFGREAIDAIVKQVEDRRDSLVVILAGYPKEMATLVDANPGFRSRFPKSILFPDYDNEELLAILSLISDRDSYSLTPEAQAAALDWFGAHNRGHGFGNGRLARNLFEAAVARHANRLVEIANPTDIELTTIESADIESVPTPPSNSQPSNSQPPATQRRNSPEPGSGGPP